MADSTITKADTDAIIAEQARATASRDRENTAAYDKQFDLYKHLTTLGASTIVVLVAFLGKPLNNDAGVCLGLSLLAMVGTVISGCLGMVCTVKVHRAFTSLFDQYSATCSVYQEYQPIAEQAKEWLNHLEAAAAPEETEKVLKQICEVETERHKWEERRAKARAETHKATVEAGWAVLCETVAAYVGTSVFIFGMLMLVLFMGNR